jgi:hypothetical protein
MSWHEHMQPQDRDNLTGNREVERSKDAGQKDVLKTSWRSTLDHPWIVRIPNWRILLTIQVFFSGCGFKWQMVPVIWHSAWRILRNSPFVLRSSYLQKGMQPNQVHACAFLVHLSWKLCAGEKNIQNIGDQKYQRIQPFLAGISSNTLAKCGAFPCLLPATPGVTKPAAVAGSRSR